MTRHNRYGTEVVVLVAEGGGDQLLAQIAMMKALHQRKP